MHTQSHMYMQTHTHMHIHTQVPGAKMNIPAQLCSYQHQHSPNFLSPPWTLPPGKPLILTDRIHFLSVHGWRRPIVCLCVRVGVRRQMFPSKGSRKEMQWRHISCLQNCFPFLPHLHWLKTSLTPSISRAGQGNPRGVPTTAQRNVCCSGFSSSTSIKRGFKIGVISLWDDSQAELLLEAA